MTGGDAALRVLVDPTFASVQSVLREMEECRQSGKYDGLQDRFCEVVKHKSSKPD